jgi:hypothetical protein
MAGNMKSTLIVLKDFFGFRTDSPNKLREFKAEVDKFTDDEKLGMAQLAAKEMGLQQDEVNFPLA